MELSKTVALTALLFILVLVFTSAISFSAETEDSTQQAAISK
jgi:hypothetical protein